MEPMCIKYRVIRFTPDRATGEWLNTGVMAYCEDTMEMGARLTNDGERILNTWGADALKCWVSTKEQFVKYIDNFEDRDDHVMQFPFPQFDCGLTIEFSNLLNVMGTNFDTELEFLAKNYNIKMV